VLDNSALAKKGNTRPVSPYKGLIRGVKVRVRMKMEIFEKFLAGIR
jgi:hypothetical protein